MENVHKVKINGNFSCQITKGLAKKRVLPLIVYVQCELKIVEKSENAFYDIIIYECKKKSERLLRKRYTEPNIGTA